MNDYKATINLPQTKFPMKANLANREPGILKQWIDMDLYAQMRAIAQGRPKFIMHDGPPYANGHIHIGHAVNKTLKDFVVKSKSLSGYDAPYIPGWDCHGLPIELNVEKKKGKAGHKFTHAEFRQACRDYANSQIDLQREEFMRLGGIGDWFNPYITMDSKYEANIIRSLAEMVARGHMQQGKKPVHWCVDCGSALAEAEVEYKDKQSPSIDVRFEILDEEALLKRCQHVPEHHGQGRLSVVIWTTTPWTLPANQAVSVHPKLVYVIAQCDGPRGKERLLLAEDLLKDTMIRYGVEHYRVIAYCDGEQLEGLKLQHPFYEREVPIVLGAHVTTDSGTGAVHTAPGHGPDDYVVGLKYGLPIDNPVADNGCFYDSTPLFGGEHISKANHHILEVLQERGRLLHSEVLKHSYPHCWRHKTPIIFRATSQWFISMDKHGLRREALDAIGQVEWIPEWGQTRIATMIENRPDWCISRQRSWGVPLCLFTHRKSGALHPNAAELMLQVAERVEQQGIEAWHQLDIKEFLGEQANEYQKSTDILDVWFDSGVSHAAVLKQRECLAFPADLYLEGSDQHRGWFQSSLLTSMGINSVAPFKQVLTHGFTVDSQGRKMSKSIGNVIAPDQVIKTLGADILRLWVASTDYRGEIAVSDEIFKRISDTYRRLRNTARYLIANLYDFDPEQHTVPKQAMLSLDRWAVDRARLLQDDIINAYDSYQYHTIYQAIHHFCSIDMGGFYLDVIKDRQYTMHKDSLARRSAQTAMYKIAHAFVRWIAPILSFTADEIWQYLPGTKHDSVHLTTWFEDFIQVTDSETMNQSYWQNIMDVRDAVNKELEAQRNAGHIGSALDANVTLYCNEQLTETLGLLGDELRFLLITSDAKVLPLAEEAQAVATDIPGLNIHVAASEHAKCIRCWHKREDVGSQPEHPELCGRCVENVAGEGEHRQFV